MAFNPNDMELTPMQVFWTPNGATAETDLGGTLGNVKISVAVEKADIKADQTGSTPLDKRVSGHKYSISTNLAQTRDFLIASYAFPNAVLVGGTPFDGSAPMAALDFVNAVGNSDLAKAGILRLHPQDVASDNHSYDWTFPLAAPSEASEITHGPATQSQWKIDWTVYPDVSGGAPYKFFRFGDTDL